MDVMKEYLTLKEISDTNKSFEVLFGKDLLIGKFIILDDGFYEFFPEKYDGGCWAAYTLRELADKLDELNKLWNDYLTKELN